MPSAFDYMSKLDRPVAGAPKRATLRDVARLAKVDPSLVSRIVNSDPKANASAETRARVLAAVAKLGYRANSAARMLKTARTQMIGLMLPDMANPMYTSIISGVEKRCMELGYGVLFGDHQEDNADKIFKDLLDQGQVDGLLIASGTLPDSFLKSALRDKSLPIVSVNRRVKGLPSSVIVNDALGATMAVEHLAKSKVTLMAGIFGPMHIDTAQRREIGFVDACKELKIKYQIISKESWGMQAGYDSGKELFSRKNPPDAIFASTVLMGIGVLRAASEMGINIPESVRVVSMHDSEIANFLIPSLTTVNMPTAEMGAEAVDLLLRVIEGGVADHLIVDTVPHLVVRESSVSINYRNAVPSLKKA